MSETREHQLVQNVLLTFFVSGAASQPLGSFIPFLREAHGLSYRFTGLMLSFQSIGNLLAVLAAGFLPIYLGRRKSILVTAVWMAVAYLIIGSGVGIPWILLLAFFMTGVARGGNSNFSNTMISTLPQPRATRGYNLLHGSFAIGALISPLVLIGLSRLNPQRGWRYTALLLFLLCVMQLVIYRIMKLPPESGERSLKSVDKSFLSDKMFWLGTIMLFFYISAEYAIVGWLVTYFQDLGIFSPSVAQLMNSLLWLVIFIGRMIGALITDKISKSKLLLIDGLGFSIFFCIMFFSRTTLWATVGIMGIGLFMATIYPTAFAFGSESIKGNDLGSSARIFTSSIGGIVTPLIVGAIAQNLGMRMGMGFVFILTLLLLLSILLSVWSARRIPKKERTA